MAESISASVKSRSGGKIYLDGTACGDTGKRYLILYGTTGDSGDIANSYYDYTIWNGGCLSLGSNDCNIPDSGDGTYRIYLDEIDADGYIVRWVDVATVVVTSEPTTVLINVYVRDQFGTGVAGAQVNIPTAIGARTITTNYQGTAVGFSLETDRIHTASVTYLPSSWETTSESTLSFGASQSGSIALEVNKKTEYCELQFNLYDQALYPVAGASCFVGGKTATTNTGGMCYVTLECGKSYTATCNAPSGYTCSCGGCDCSDGPFTLTADGYVSFFMDKVPEPIVYCQQDFKVIDQNGDPVEYAIVGCEDRTDHTNFDVTGHAGTGTMRDGTISTIRTITGRSYNFYMSQYPAGYEFDIDGESIFTDVIACRGEVVFRVKNLAVVPDPCTVNVCVQDQNGGNITGVSIYITGIGTVSTKSDISMFGCTGVIGLVCNDSITVTATVPTGYEGVKITETFNAIGNKSVILTIKESSVVTDCDGKTQIECNVDPNCYWWASDEACHGTPETTTYPTLKITSDVDVIGGLGAEVDGENRGTTPVTISFVEGDIGRTVSVTGSFAGAIKAKTKDITLNAGSNEVSIDILMDNKEILAGGTIATALLVNYGM